MSKKLRVKLITLPWELEVPTLSLACLAAVTPRKHFDVCIVDLLRERLVLDEPVDLVGISASTPRINAAYALADIYRERGVKVVLGGHHVTALPDEGLLHADAIVRGEGEGAWLQICRQMLEDPGSIGGIYDVPAPDLATLPQPRTELMKLHRYQRYYYPVLATRGCPQTCGFCFAKKMTFGYRTHPLRYVIEQVRNRPKWVKAMYFVDDNLAGDIDYARDLFRELKRYKVPFGMQVRHEFSHDPENLRLAREAGCCLISSGYESVNQTSLDRVGKSATATMYKEIINAIQGHGMIASGNWMFGFDWDTPDIFEQTWAFLRESGITHSSFTVEIPFPGTAGFKRYQREGRILTTNYDAYSGKDSVVHRPKQMSPQELRDGIRWLARKYYSVRHRSRIWKDSLANKNLFAEYAGLQRPVAVTALNAYQVWLWKRRMTPSLTWLASRLVRLNKHTYVRDRLRGTNFWQTRFPATNPGTFDLISGSRFADDPASMGFKEKRLVTSWSP